VCACVCDGISISMCAHTARCHSCAALRTTPRPRPSSRCPRQPPVTCTGARECFCFWNLTLCACTHSVGVIAWELCAATVAGAYARPFAEYHGTCGRGGGVCVCVCCVLCVLACTHTSSLSSDYTFDFQIFARVAQKHVRPSLPAKCPQSIAGLVRACVNECVCTQCAVCVLVVCCWCVIDHSHARA
jgi:hypothetical protein